jgi:hypothetical protein
MPAGRGRTAGVRAGRPGSREPRPQTCSRRGTEGDDRACPVGPIGPILRKEVIQPQVPLRLPCYDFTPVADPTVVACLPRGLAQRLRVKPTPMV